ncbi:hypothetical protein [Saccharopolyspora elongata]|uniref:Lipoprotein n=1 Tax=Saccharopolyspora elongata TaxID=2530387 RepID=A0A4R4XSB7_9PSEU|nr:hypothetical protein [Saccharopolyspora elongata]TDD34351.1 hypothetical protein E1288_44505 [Saccharopolyspora elongata]
MSKPATVLAVSAAAMLLAACAQESTGNPQDYPSRSIRLISPFKRCSQVGFQGAAEDRGQHERAGFEPGLAHGVAEEAGDHGETMSDGDPTIFVTRPVSLVLCTLFVAVLMTGMWLAAKKRRTQNPSSAVARTG